ncbi:MAG TPA: hypothetical protein VII65_04585 [Acidimicrobiales bacterium]
MLKRLFRIATAASLGRAVAQKSPKWLSIAFAIVLLRFFNSRSAKAAKAAKRAKRESK